MISVNILGTKYEVEIVDLNDSRLTNCDGKCYVYDKKILVRDPHYMFSEGDSDVSKTTMFQEVLIHELIHAISKESATQYDEDEVLVDWIAQMIPKICDAYDEVRRQLKELENEDKN